MTDKPSAEAMERVLSTIRPFWQQMYGYPPNIIPALAAALDAFAAEARAAYRQSLDDAGMVVVPKEPTEAMLKAAWDSGWAATMTEDDDFSRWYRSMLSAAPPADAK